MIRVTLDLDSALGADRDRLLGTVNIINVGGDAQRGNYTVMARNGSGRLRYAVVKNFPRKSRTALELLRRALNALHEQGNLP